MAHLLTAEHRSRRRVRVQNVLVLALRAAAVALLVLLFARPAVAGRRPAGTAAGDGRVVLLLDDSAGMGRLAAGTTAFERAVDTAAAMADGLAGGGAGLTAFVASEEEPFFEAAPMDAEKAREFRTRARARTPVAVPFDPAARLRALAKSAAGPGDVRFIVASDLQAADWGEGAVRPEAAEALRALQARGPVWVWDVGAAGRAGVRVAEILDDGRPVYARAATVLRVVIENESDADRPAGPVEVRVDGRVLPSVPGPAVPAGQRRQAAVQVYLEEPGFHRIEAAVEGGDDFPADDRRTFAFEAVESLPVLVVEGGLAARPADAAGYYLRAALQPSDGAGPGLRVTGRPAQTGPPDDLDRYAAVFLCGVRSPDGWLDALRGYVGGGGRLVVFLDDEAGADAYAQGLLGPDGLLPCRPGELVRARADGVHRLAHLEFADPLLRPFPDWGMLFHMVEFRAFRRVEPLGETRVLARFDDAAASPALLAGRFGRGEVVLLPFTANDAWTDWPRSEAGRVTYVALMHWLAEQGAAGARRRGYGLDLPAGARLEFPLDPARFRTQATLRGPDAAAGGAAASDGAAASERLQARSLPDRGGLWLAGGPLRRAGFHELRLTALDGGETSVHFAVHLPDRERLPARIARDALEDAAGDAGRLHVTGYEAVGMRAWAGAARPVWPYLAGVVLAVLLVESLLAWRFGNPRAGRPERPARRGGAP